LVSATRRFLLLLNNNIFTRTLPITVMALFAFYFLPVLRIQIREQR
jgi:hypothetical protein